MHQTIIIRYDEIIPFTVNIILYQHYCSILSLSKNKWHNDVVQCSVSVSESLMLQQALANKYYVIVLCWHQSHAVSFVLTLVLMSVTRTMFTRLQKPGFMPIVKTTPHSTRASQPLMTELMAFVFWVKIQCCNPDFPVPGRCLDKHGWLVA